MCELRVQSLFDGKLESVGACSVNVSKAESVDLLFMDHWRNKAQKLLSSDTEQEFDGK
jgi:hypothetical protein